MAKNAVWLKVDSNVRQGLETGRLATALAVSREEAVGLLLLSWLFCWENMTGEECVVACTIGDLDRAVGRQGLAVAMFAVGLIVVGDGVISFPSLEGRVSATKGLRGRVPYQPALLGSPTTTEPEDDSVFLSMPKKRTAASPGETWVLRRSQVEKWKKLFPGLDVEAVCHRFAAWWSDKPASRVDWTDTLEGWLHKDYAKLPKDVTAKAREENRKRVFADAYTTGDAKLMAGLCDPRIAAIRKLEELRGELGTLPTKDLIRLEALKGGLVPGREDTVDGQRIITQAKATVRATMIEHKEKP